MFQSLRLSTKFLAVWRLRLTPLRPSWPDISQMATLTLRRTEKVIASRWYKGGGGRSREPLPRSFDILQYFENILPSAKATKHGRHLDGPILDFAKN